MDIIFAIDLNYGISKLGNLPWKIPVDIKYLKDMIKNKHYLAGYKTNLEMLKYGYKNNYGSNEKIIVGGKKIIEDNINNSRFIYVTKILHNYDCDIRLNINIDKFTKLYSKKFILPDTKNKISVPICFEKYSKYPHNTNELLFRQLKKKYLTINNNKINELLIEYSKL
jgi:dihydrofolate reductase